MRLFLILSLFAFTSYAEGKESSPESSVARIHAHLVIKDYRTACQEGQELLEHYPDSKKLWEAYIEALGKNGEESRMIAAWDSYVGQFPEEKNNRQVLEEIAWNVIGKGASSSSPIIRTTALLGAYLGQDARGITILQANLKDHSSLIRAIAVQLSARLLDDRLCDEVVNLFKSERSWQVRLEAIRAVGTMKITEVHPDLVAFIANPKSTAEEKAAATQALVNILDTAERDEVINLAKSDRAGLRQLACQVVAYFDLDRDADQVIHLLNDHHAEVRSLALQTLGTLGIKSYEGESIADIAERMLGDPDPSTAILAAWLLTIHNNEKGQQAFVRWFNHKNQAIRLQAASALTATGKHGFPLTLEIFQKTEDPYVRMNLALGLIHQRTQHAQACDALYKGLQEESGRWMWKQQGIFQILAPSNLRYQATIPNYPEVVNQLTRLEILNILAMMDHPKAQEAIKWFLSEKAWGVSGLASTLLLTECDEAAIELVEGLLDDPNQKVHVQAALILALWGRNEAALDVLQNAYAESDRDLKEKILESLGHTGAESSIPFLIERLHEPFQSLRLIAASSLLQCLYH